jgi:hypothetical protein
MPSGIVKVAHPSELHFFLIKKNEHGVPKMSFNLEILEDLTFDMWYVS